MSAAAAGVWKPRSALAAYRALLRAQRDLFVNDLPALISAREETRAAFLAQADAKPEDVPALVEDAFEASHFIRQNVAQAQLSERGNYGELLPHIFWPILSCLHFSCHLIFGFVHAELKPRPEHIHEGSTPPPLPCKEDFNR